MDREKVIAWLADEELYYRDHGDTHNSLMACDAIELLKDEKKYCNSCAESAIKTTVELQEEIARLRSLLKEQDAKTGHWIYKKYDDMFMCSCCEKYSIRNDYPYCHWCGAKMDMDDEVDWR